jgi:presenilin-like A22 family membrane protease
MFAGCLMTIAVYVFVFVRIKAYERRTNSAALATALPKTAKDKTPLTDYIVVVSYILFICLHLVLVIKINSLDMLKMHVFPNYLFIYYLHLWLLPNFSLMLIALYFWRNHSLRVMVSREVKEHLSKYLVLKS